jgi:hypothetical protein
VDMCMCGYVHVCMCACVHVHSCSWLTVGDVDDVGDGTVRSSPDLAVTYDHTVDRISIYHIESTHIKKKDTHLREGEDEKKIPC